MRASFFFSSDILGGIARTWQAWPGDTRTRTPLIIIRTENRGSKSRHRHVHVRDFCTILLSTICNARTTSANSPAKNYAARPSDPHPHSHRAAGCKVRDRPQLPRKGVLKQEEHREKKATLLIITTLKRQKNVR